MPQHLPAFIVAAATILVVPGPDFVLVTRYGVTRGAKAAAATAAGFLSGLVVHTGLAVAGLAALLAAAPGALTALRWAGALYLAGLGVLMLRAGRKPAPETGEAPTADGLKGAYLQGLLNNLLNPKALLFFVALLPPFVSPEGSAAVQTVLLAALVIVMAAVWWTAYICVLTRASRVLRRPRVQTAVGVGSGGALIGLGGLLAWSS